MESYLGKEEHPIQNFTEDDLSLLWDELIW